MKQRLSVLQAKLSRPNCGQSISRKRLLNKLRSATGKKLALIVAGAGYGKTTIATQLMDDSGLPNVWYSLDSMDVDFSTFLTYLVAGIQQHVPHFGAELISRLNVPIASANWRQMRLLEFLAEFEHNNFDNFIIVLDDFHTVQKSQEILNAFSFLLSRCSSHLHWILLTRSDPPLKLSKYRIENELIEISEAELAFHYEETKTLYHGLLKAALSEKVVQMAYKNTEGWPAGLMLVYNAVECVRDSDQKASLFDIRKSKHLIHRYLEEHIFDHQPEKTKQFMMKASLLSHIDPEFCDRVFCIKESRSILTTLCQHHLLTFPCSDADETFYFHHLLKEFLTERLKRTKGAEQLRYLHYKIGIAMERDDNIQGALNHFLMANRFDEICRVIEAMVFSNFMEFPFRFFLDIFEQIPANMLMERPRILYMSAKLAGLAGDVDFSLREFKHALSIFRAMGDSTGILTCQKELAFNYYLNGDILKAKMMMDELWGKRHDDMFFPSEIAGYLILFSSILGDFEEADKYYFRARRFTSHSEGIKLLENSYLDLCISYRYHSAGEFKQAEKLNQKTLDTLIKIGMEPLQPLSFFHASLSQYFLHKSEDGLKSAEKGIVLAEQLEIWDAQYAWLLYAKALNLLGCKQFGNAKLTAEESRRIFCFQGHEWGQASVWELFGWISIQVDNFQDAEAYFRKAQKLLHGKYFPLAKGSIALNLAEVLIEGDNAEAAESIMSFHDFEIGLSAFYKFRLYLLRARILYKKGNAKEGKKLLKLALSISQRNEYGRWVIDHLPKIGTPLINLYDHNIMRSYIRELLSQGGESARNLLQNLKIENGGKAGFTASNLLNSYSIADAAPLDIRGLGAIYVSVVERQILKEQWKSAKAKKLFQYLILHAEKGYIPKDVLIEFIWPDEDADRTSSRFHVAMTFLRRILEPELQRGVSSAYLLRRETAYRLDLGKCGRIDFVEFCNLIANAQKLEQQDFLEAVAFYLKAESIYTGQLFSEDPYEDGFIPERERLQDLYIHLLQRLILHWEKQQLWDQCIAYTQKLLSIDPYLEEAYCKLMEYHINQGDITRAVRSYERCKFRITEELGFPLQNRTEKFYETLINAPRA